MLAERDIKGWPKILVGEMMNGGTITEMGIPGVQTCLGGMILVLDMVNLRDVQDTLVDMLNRE